MKNSKKKIVSVLLVAALLVMQFSLLGGTFTVSATSYSELTGRSGFMKGVNMHAIGNANNYQDAQYSAMIDAESLGANFIRYGGTPDSADDYTYYKSMINIASQKGLDTLFVYAANIFKDFTAQEATDKCTVLATQFNGKVKYYQLGNELENAYLKDGQDGRDTWDYYSVSTLASVITAATNAIKAVDPNAKTVVNFGWLHYGYIQALLNAGATFDYIGLDWYYSVNNQYPQTYNDVFTALSGMGKQIIVCEANVQATGWNEADHTQVTYNNNLSWLADFYTAAYNNNNVIGFFPYEIYDEASRGATEFHQEGHYGLIDPWGNRKASFTYLQQLYGGTDVARGTVTSYTGETVGDTVTGTLVDGIFSTNQTVNRRFGSMFLDTNLSADVDLTGGWSDWKSDGFIEFDLYMEDAQALKTYANDAGATLKVQVWGSDGKTRVNNSSKVIPVSLIKNDGWNHITLRANTLNDGNVSCYTCVNRVAIGLRGADNDLKIAASGMKYAVANVRGTRLVGEYISTVGTPYANQLPLNGYYGNWGNASGARIEYPLQALNVGSANISALVNNNGYIEFDFYVENYANLMQSLREDVNGNTHSLVLNFYISSRTDGLNGNFFRYDLGAQLKQDGWNHIVFYLGSSTASNISTPLQTASLDGTSVKSFGLRFVGTPAGNIAAAQDAFAIKNITTTLATAPAPETVGEVVGTVFDAQKTSTSVNTSNYRIYDSGSNAFNANLSSMWASDAGLVEFDLFISNAEKLKEAMNAGSYFTLQVIGDNSLNREAHFSFKGNSIHHNGWNHIVLSRQNFGGSGSNWSAVRRVIIGFYTYASPGVAPNSTCQSVVYSIANFKGTVANKVTAATEGILYENQMTMGNTTNSFGDRGALKSSGIALSALNVSAVTNLSALFNNGFIEFDLYVSSYEALQRSLTQDVGGNAHTLELDFYLSSNTSNIAANFFRYNIGGQITQNGWNHIVLKFAGANFAADPQTPVQTSGMDQTAVRSFGLRFVGAAAGRIESGYESFIFSNIAATEALEIPAPYVEDATDVISDFTTVTFGGDGEYTIEAELDISEDRMVELDVYLTEALTDPLTIAFTDNGGDMAYYDYEALSVGWNHITLRLADFDDTCDFSDIAGVSLYSDAGARIGVANFYTADYLDGDANRDAAFNILDLIAAKKYASNPGATRYNLAAMDMDGANYIVNANDLGAMTTALLQ